jgi:hypothetical protein
MATPWYGVEAAGLCERGAFQDGVYEPDDPGPIQATSRACESGCHALEQLDLQVAAVQRRARWLSVSKGYLALSTPAEVAGPPIGDHKE